MHKDKDLNVTNIPCEVKVVGGYGPKKEAIPSLLHSLFWLSNTFLYLTLLDMPIEILKDIKTCLKRFEYNTCELWIEVKGRIDSEWTKAIMMLHNHFKREATYFKSFNRLKIVPLIRLEDLTNAGIKESLALKNYFKRFGLNSLFLLRWHDFDDFGYLDSALKEPPLKNKNILIYSETINAEIIKLASEYNNILTLHDGVNRCIHFSAESNTKLYCGAGSEKLFVYLDKVYPCYGAFLVGSLMGNISTGSLEEILDGYQLPTLSEQAQECSKKHFCGQCRFMPNNCKRNLL